MFDNEAAPATRFFTHVVIENFLAPALVQRLLDHVAANRHHFTPKTVRE